MKAEVLGLGSRGATGSEVSDREGRPVWTRHGQDAHASGTGILPVGLRPAFPSRLMHPGRPRVGHGAGVEVQDFVATPLAEPGAMALRAMADWALAAKLPAGTMP